MEQPTMAKKDEYDEWEIDSDIDTLIRANDILNDETKLPKIKTRYAEKQKAMVDTAKQLNLETKTKKAVKKLLGKK